jgi:methylenetetrahydrofolate reductase (NADPH)
MSERPTPTFSFELYPPRNEAAAAALYENLPALVAPGPEFMSVTYGANGSSRDSSLAVLQHLISSTSVESMAHITCVGSSYSEASALIRQFLDAGVTSFLAVRGDPPAGVSEEEAEEAIARSDLHSAGELVQLIHRVQTEREPYAHYEIPGFPQAKRIGRGREVTIAVAAFPNGHPRSRSRSQDLDTLLAKEAAGANLAITQLFFEADDYLGFVDDARAAGVTMRILPGIMPVLSVQRLHRMLELSGEPTPQALLSALEAADSPEAAQRIGIEACVRLAGELLDGGAPGIHLYTFNRSDAPLAVLEGVGLISASKGSPT